MISQVWARFASRWLITLLYASCSSAATMPHPTATPAARMCWEAQSLTTTPHDELDPQWSPDGTRIGFVGHHEGNPEVYVLDVASRAIRNVSNMPEDDYRPNWSPDGQYLAFIHRIRPYTPDAGHLTLVDATTGAQIFSSVGTTYSAQWSADSQQLLFVQERTSYLSLDVESGLVRELFGFPPSPTNRFQVSELISPDGQWALLEAHATPSDDQTGTYIINTGTGNADHILQEYVQYPIWSPDSKRIAFTVGEFPDEIILYTYDVRTRELKEVYGIEEDGWIYPRDWSPDNRLAWLGVTADQQQATSLYIQPVDGQIRELWRINHPIGTVRWSPTRDQIAFQTYAGIYVADVPSGVFHEFVQALGRFEPLVWSPDGNYIAANLQASSGNVDRMVITDIRTGSLYIYGEEDPKYIRSQPQWSPDSRQVIVSAGRTWGEADLVLFSPCANQE